MRVDIRIKLDLTKQSNQNIILDCLKDQINRKNNSNKSFTESN